MPRLCCSVYFSTTKFASAAELVAIAGSLCLEAKPFHTYSVLLDQLVAFATFLAVEQETLITSLFLVQAYTAWLGFVCWGWGGHDRWWFDFISNFSALY